MGEDKITSEKRKAMDQINELFRGIRELRNQFLLHARKYFQALNKNNRNEAENHRKKADDISGQIFGDLLRIVGIAERIDDEASKNTAVLMMKKISETRKLIGLKTQI